MVSFTRSQLCVLCVTVHNKYRLELLGVYYRDGALQHMRKEAKNGADDELNHLPHPRYDQVTSCERTTRSTETASADCVTRAWLMGRISVAIFRSPQDVGTIVALKFR